MYLLCSNRDVEGFRMIVAHKGDQVDMFWRLKKFLTHS